MTVRVVLVGLPGCGKTTVGALLAQALGVEFVDVDDEVLARTGMSAASWLRTAGEAEFRLTEAAALEQALSGGGPAVVATGGGAVESAASRARLAREPLVVYLECSPDVLVARLEGGDRPLIAGPTTERLAELAARRRPLYEEVAAATVDGDAPMDVVAAAIEALVVRA